MAIAIIIRFFKNICNMNQQILVQQTGSQCFPEINHNLLALELLFLESQCAIYFLSRKDSKYLHFKKYKTFWLQSAV